MLEELLNELNKMRSESQAYRSIELRNNQVLQYIIDNKVGMLGQNIWHIIFDDAIRMRKELEKK